MGWMNRASAGHGSVKRNPESAWKGWKGPHPVTQWISPEREAMTLLRLADNIHNEGLFEIANKARADVDPETR